MLQALSAEQLCLKLAANQLGFADTSELAGHMAEWVGQGQARQAAEFGLRLKQPGFHLMIVGEPGRGRSSLVLRMMQEIAGSWQNAADLLLLHDFDTPQSPRILYLPAGHGATLRQALDQAIRGMHKVIPSLLAQAGGEGESQLTAAQPAVEAWLKQHYLDVEKTVHGGAVLHAYLQELQRDLLENLELFQGGADSEEALAVCFSRYRANLLVSNGHLSSAPVIYDDDPGHSSLFGGIEPTSEHSGAADFMRLRAGNILRAHGGMLMLHLRDLQADQQGGNQLQEKLHRYLRNGRVQIEENAGGANSPLPHLHVPPMQANVKLVLVATREEYYLLLEDAPEFAGYFRILVDFEERSPATPALYRSIAGHVALRCKALGLPNFSAGAMAVMLRALHRQAEDQTYVSTDFGMLEGLIIESATHAAVGGHVGELDVEAALAARRARHSAPERQMREAVIAGDVMIRLQGREIGQINGLTHVELAEGSFGAPVRITARCFAGEAGIINIGREVALSGPNHDKGVLILQGWLAASFADLTPLSLSASLVFEQEYHGVEGDSASCAELYALLSALAGVPLPQGIAITGALNQHGEVMPVGGINEKIEGYFRICQQAGLDGSHGVMIPKLNLPHLMLDRAVVQAVAAGSFQIISISHVLEGIAHLAGIPAAELDEAGHYRPETIMGRVQRTLERFRDAFRRERQQVLLRDYG